MKSQIHTSRPLILIMLLAAMLVSGCVTTTDSGFAREADKDAAVQNYVRLATSYLSQGNYERARKHLDRALELDSSDAGALAAQGLMFQAEGDPDLADESFRQALKSDPGYTRGRVFYGAFLYNRGRYLEARDQFETATRNTGYEDRASVFFNLGRVEERLGNLEAAASAYRRAAELKRGDPDALLAASRVLVELGEFSDASRYYSRLDAMIKRIPKVRHSAESLWTGIRIARHFGQQDQASSLALSLRNRFPDSEEYRQYRSMKSDDS